MNSQDFQNICSNLEAKYKKHALTDADVDSFADIITNILSRDDLRAEKTAYASLSRSISHDYENDINMNPLLARMYELFRMYERYRPRPLTEMERKAEQLEIEKSGKMKRSTIFTMCCNGVGMASIWYEDLENADGIMSKIKRISENLLGISRQNDEEAERTVLNALNKAGAIIDELDENSLEMCKKHGVMLNTECATNIVGIIGLGLEGVERNRARGGIEVKFDLDSETVRMDAYTVYGSEFYRQITGESIDTSLLPEIRDTDIDIEFSNADSATIDWHERLDDVFSIPGSPNLVGTKKPLRIC